VIAVSTPTDGQQQAIARQAVQGLKRKPVTTAVGNLGIPVLTYHFPERHGLSSVSFGLHQHLLYPYKLPASTNLDLLWSTGWMCHDESQPTPNWSGYMQHVCTSQHATISDVLFLPIININPADHSYMFSTVSFSGSHGGVAA